MDADRLAQIGKEAAGAVNAGDNAAYVRARDEYRAAVELMPPAARRVAAAAYQAGYEAVRQLNTHHTRH